jgi:hypothetical protein
MRTLCVFLLAVGVCTAQQPWRRTLMDLTARPAGQLTLLELEQLEAAALLAGAYFQGLRPGDFEANREFMRRIATYVATVEALNRDPRIRMGIGRAYLAVARFRWAAPVYVASGAPPMQNPAGQDPGPPPPPEEPRFSLNAPEIGRVQQADQAAADDLITRYELAAGKAAVAWKSAAVLRRSLMDQGMALNAQTESSLARIQIYFDLAVDALKARDWAEARTNIERGEYETEKVNKVTGR